MKISLREFDGGLNGIESDWTRFGEYGNKVLTLRLWHNGEEEKEKKWDLDPLDNIFGLLDSLKIIHKKKIKYLK